MNRVLPGEKYPGYYRNFYRIDPGTVRDVRCRNFQKRASSAVDRSDKISPTRWTPDIDCDNAWQIENFDPLPQADKGECENI